MDQEGWLSGAKKTQVICDGVLHKIKPIWAIDKDPLSCHTFQKNIINHNSKIINGAQLKTLTDYDKNIIINDQIEHIERRTFTQNRYSWFWFPSCNDYSIMGEKKGI